MFVYDPFCPSINSALSLNPAVSELPKATNLVKFALPAVNGSSTTAVVSSSLSHAIKVAATKNSHLKFFIIFIKYYIFLIN